MALDKTGLERLWTNIVARLGDKVNVEEGKGLSSNDYTNADKDKLTNIESGAQVNVQSDWRETDSSSDAFIPNKPVSYTDVSITWDGNTNDLASVVYNSTKTLYKVSDYVFEENQFVNGEYKTYSVSNGEAVDYTYPTTPIYRATQITGDALYFSSACWLVSVLKAGQVKIVGYTITFPETGIYFCYYKNSSGTSIQYATELNVSVEKLNSSTLPVATDYALGAVKAIAKTDDMTQAVGVDENGNLWTAGTTGVTEYELPVANNTTLGGVKPVAKTDAMTQSVGVDANGALWTTSSSSSGSGEDGYTPVRGVDYWTEEDQAQIVADVIAALPNASGEVF